MSHSPCSWGWKGSRAPAPLDCDAADLPECGSGVDNSEGDAGPCCASLLDRLVKELPEHGCDGSHVLCKAHAQI